MTRVNTGEQVNTEVMISIHLAQDLALAGLRWTPVPGDRFTLTAEELTGDVFTVSEMTIEAHEYSSGTILGFNGTTEWALDSVTLDEALWLPSEAQMRELLGRTFVSLTRSATGDQAPLFVVETILHGQTQSFESANAADAYARALLSLISAAAELT